MKKLTLLVIFALILFSCKKEEQPILILSQSEISISENGGTSTMVVTSNNSWSASCPEWCTISPSKGSPGETPVIIQIEQNNTFAQRTGDITFTSNGISATASIRQEMNYGVYVPKQEYEISNNDQTLKFEVKGNVKYNVSIDENSKEWITQKNTKSTSEILEFEIKKNTTYESRTGYITIKEESGKTTKITVSQSQMDGLFTLHKNLYIDAEGGILKVETLTNIKLDLTIPNGINWIKKVSTRGLDTIGFNLEISSNITNEQSRTADIYISSPSSPLKDTVKITQGGSYVNIPDNAFRSYIIGKYDLDSDGKISFREAEQITEISISGREYKIYSLEGIEYFPNLTNLTYDGGECLKSVDVSKNTNLEKIYLDNNLIENIDLSNNKKLNYISLYFNKLNKLDIHNNTQLTYLCVSGNNLTTLDLSNNTLLETITCSNNKLKELDLSNLNKLKRLWAWENEMEYISFKANHALTDLKCSDNKLQTIDFSECPNLHSISISYNLISSLKLENMPYLYSLGCGSNKIEELQIINCPNIYLLSISDNKIKELDLSQLHQLYQLYCSDNYLSVLDITRCRINDLYTCGNPDLRVIFVPDDFIVNDRIKYDSHTSISFKRDIIIPDEEFRKLLMQQYDYDRDNILTTAELAKVESLSLFSEVIRDLRGLEYMPNLKHLSSDRFTDTILNLSNNPKLTSLDLRYCTKLKKIYVWPGFQHINNPNFNTAPSVAYEEIDYVTVKDANFRGKLLGNFDLDYDGRISTYEAQRIYSIGVSTNNIHTVEGIEHFPNLVSLRCSGSSGYDNEEGQLTHIDISKNLKLHTLYCSYNKLTTIDLSKNKNLEDVIMNFNKIKTFDLSDLNKLRYFGCAGDKVDEIILKGNEKLDTLNCSRSNNLKTLNLSEAKNLTFLNANSCSLENINLQKNNKLKVLRLGYNNLTNIDLSSQTALIELIIGSNKQLTELDVSYSPNIKEIYSKSCTNLKTIYLKEGVNPRVVSCDSHTNIAYK